MQVGYTGAEPSRLRRASALRRTDVQIAVRIGVQTARPRPGLAPPYLCCIAIERHSHVACSPSAPRVACATRLVTLGNLLKPAARPDCCVARCSESSCTRMYTAVPAPHMEVQVSREAGCRKRPLRAPCTRSLRDHACCAGCARSEEHTSELQSLMRISYAVFCLQKKKQKTKTIIAKNKTRRQQPLNNTE